MPETQCFTALPGRLDKVLSALCPQLSRARLQALIKEGQVKVEGKALAKASQLLKGGERIELSLPETRPARPRPRKIPLEIVYEDKHLLVINKPAGLVVHPAAGHAEDTLVNALLAHCGKSLSGIGGEARPGIVHRLDKDTSGLLVVAKNDKAHRSLSAQFSGAIRSVPGAEAPGTTARAQRELSRVYEAFVWGLPKSKRGKIEGDIGRSPHNRKKMALVKKGKAAVTHYEVLEAYAGIAARLSCRLETGRTHQIRVHLASIGHAVIGDALYGKAAGQKAKLRDWGSGIGDWKYKNSKNLPSLQSLVPSPDFILTFPRQALHAAELSFTHPVTGKKMHFTARPPADLLELERSLKKL